MNDQHAKMYEQLDVAARDLEQGNQRLVRDNRQAQQKIQRYFSQHSTVPHTQTARPYTGNSINVSIHCVLHLNECRESLFSFSLFCLSLTETAEGLQTYMEDLQVQVEELKAAQAERNQRELAEQRRSLGAQSVSCLKELYDLHQDRYSNESGTIFRKDLVWESS